MEAKAPLRIDTADLDGGLGAGGNLSERLARVLSQKIGGGAYPPGTRLPTESALVQRFGVSRTVVREAIATLKAEGLVETRQGSGAFVCQPAVGAVFHIDPVTSRSIQSLLGLIEVRRGMEAELAALAAERRNSRQLAEIRRAEAQIDKEVTTGGDHVGADVAFHLAIALATGNPYWVKLVDMFAQQMRAAVAVTRANEARSELFAEAVRTEHARIVEAIARRDPVAARLAAAAHMQGAAARVIAADQEFWNREGGEYARHLTEKS